MIPGFSNRHLWTLLAIILGVRLLTMALFPVMDTTESRYAEISRLVMISGEWLMPQFEPGVPFWGKPPLFAWLTAGSFSVFGDKEFWARLPHFLLALATLWLVAAGARFEFSRQRVLLALVVLASTPLFFATAGTVMTESGLLFSTTLCMVAFWRWAGDGDRRWALAFFAGLGLGMLAKGPVAVAMTALPLVFWATANRQWRKLLALPWLAGIPLFLLIALPWYVAAERHSPGFLEYFLVGEHFLRFVQPGWSGDLYGNAHREPPGMIWLLWFQATAAWGVLMAVVAGRFTLRRLRARSLPWPEMDPWRSYLACWMLTPLLFFTFSGNVLWTYVLSGLPAFALLLVDGWEDTKVLTRPVRAPGFSALALLVPLASLLFLYLGGAGRLQLLSEKELVAAWTEREPSGKRPLHYLNYLPESAIYYSARKATTLTGADVGLHEKEFWLAVHRIEGDASRWDCALEFQPRTGLFDLYLCRDQ